MKRWPIVLMNGLNAVGALAGIASLVLMLSGQEKAAIYAFHAFLGIMFLAFLSFYIYKYNFFAKNPFEILYTHIRWTWLDDTKTIYEVLRVIKIRKLYVGAHDFKCFWSGQGTFVVKSMFGNNITSSGNSSNVVISYPINGYLGEVKTIHYSVETEDTAHKQSPFLEASVSLPTDAMIMEVVLKHKEKNNPANLLIYNKSQCLESAVKIEEIHYDQATRCYRHVICNPIISKQYRLTWEK